LRLTRARFGVCKQKPMSEFTPVTMKRKEKGKSKRTRWRKKSVSRGESSPEAEKKSTVTGKRETGSKGKSLQKAEKKSTAIGKRKRQGKKKRTSWRKKSVPWMREAFCKEILSQHFAGKEPQSMCIFSLDYDNCSSIITSGWIKRIFRVYYPGDKEFHEKVSQPIKQLVKKLDETYGCVNVVCGSARQNVKSDDFNRSSSSRSHSRYHDTYPELKMKKGEGSVFSDLENFVSMLQDDEDYISKWKLWKLLFPDGEKKEGNSWKNPSVGLIGLDTLKQNLIEFQIKRAVVKYGTKFDFVFVDDSKDILEALKKMLDDEPEWLPSSVSVYLYRYDYFGLAEENDEKAFGLHAKIN